MTRPGKYRFIVPAVLLPVLVLTVGFFVYRWQLIHGYGPGFLVKSDSATSQGKPAKLRFITAGHVRHMRYAPQRILSENVPLLGELFTTALPAVRELNPDLLFITGDVLPLASYNPFKEDPVDVEKERDLFQRCWDRVFDELSVAGCPVHIAPGNHEYFNPVSEAVFTERVGPVFGSMSRDGARFVWLNSCRSQTSTTNLKRYAAPADISEEQLAFLRDGFAGRWTEAAIFVLVHHSPMGIKNWKTAVEPILRGGRCKAVFSGTRSGGLRYRERRGIHYFDGGFDTQNRTPSYLVKTTLYPGGDMTFTVFPVTPPTLTGKLNVLLQAAKRAPFLIWISLVLLVAAAAFIFYDRSTCKKNLKLL